MTTLRMHHGESLFAASCLNCKAGLVGDFCHLCGQSAKTARITLPSILREIPNAIWTVNRALPFTLLGLATRPGHLVRDYIEGRRARIYSPLALLFLVSGIVGLVTGWFHLSDAGLDVIGHKSSEQVALGEKIVDYYAWIAMLTVPLQAAGPYIILRKRLRFTFGEHLMIAAMVATGSAIVGACALPVEWMLRHAHHNLVLGPAMACFEIAKIVYLGWAYAQLQDDGRLQESAWRRWGRGIGGYFTNILFWAVVLTAFTVSAIAGIFALRAYYRF